MKQIDGKSSVCKSWFVKDIKSLAKGEQFQCLVNRKGTLNLHFLFPGTPDVTNKEDSI